MTSRRFRTIPGGYKVVDWSRNRHLDDKINRYDAWKDCRNRGEGEFVCALVSPSS